MTKHELKWLITKLDSTLYQGRSIGDEMYARFLEDLGGHGGEPGDDELPLLATYWVNEYCQCLFNKISSTKVPDVELIQGFLVHWHGFFYLYKSTTAYTLKDQDGKVWHETKPNQTGFLSMISYINRMVEAQPEKMLEKGEANA